MYCHRKFKAGERPGLHFWRDSNGIEVDVLIEQGSQLMPVKIKAGTTVARDFFSGLEKWRGLAGDLACNPALIYGGEISYLHKGVRIVGWPDIPTAAQTINALSP
jgi:predicted AAA+ superfamily ATPase